MICLSAARYTMIATVRRGAVINDQAAPENGRFARVQDPITGDMSYVWEENELPEGSPAIDTRSYKVPCQAKAFTDTGYRSSSNTEEFDKGKYRVFEFVEMRFAPKYHLTRRDTVTSIRDALTGKALWTESDAELNGEFPPTVFEVVGVNPITDPFGTHIENLTVLKRASVQSDG